MGGGPEMKLDLMYLPPRRQASRWAVALYPKPVPREPATLKQLEHLDSFPIC